MKDSVLDNPVWWAMAGLDGRHTAGGDLARRFPVAMSPFAGVVDEDLPAAWAQLVELSLGEPVAVIARAVPEGWTELRELPLVQMTFEGEAPLPVSAALEPLGASDAADMVDLATRTEPGPFGAATIDFGGYRGLRIGGVLACMGGERMHPGDWTEVSAVCTDPAFRGRGLAAAVVASLVNDIRAAGRGAYLNVAIENHGARRVYERLGFRERARMSVRVIEPTGGRAR